MKNSFETLEAIVKRLLEQRNLPVRAGLSGLSPFRDLYGCNEAAAGIVDAILNNQTICVWGDYDVDGVTSTALAVGVLEDIAKLNRKQIRLLYHIPRRSDGYGLNSSGIMELSRRGVKTLVTVDCGISGVKEIDLARSLGMRAIVTDHHLPGPVSPRADALCDPWAGSETHQEYAGAGVIFMVMTNVCRRLAKEGWKVPDMRFYLDLAALGTIADVAALGQQNRIICQNGLKLLAVTERPGIKALKMISGIPEGDDIWSEDIGFSFGPRLNAAGRMEDPGIALDLLRAKDIETALPLARRLEELNSMRKAIERKIVAEAMEIACENTGCAIVVCGENWNHGVLGIAASRIASMFKKPVLLLSKGSDGMARGSGRSAAGINLYAALAECPSLARFGGHAMAAGAACRVENLETLAREFDEATGKQERQDAELPNPDGMMAMASLKPEDISAMRMMEPAGAGNPFPVLLSEPVVFYDYSERNDYVSMDFMIDGGQMVRGSRWQPDFAIDDEMLGQMFRMLWTPRNDRRKGELKPEIIGFVTYPGINAEAF